MKSYVFPGNIDADIEKIGSEPIPYMRTAQFSEMNKESEKILLDLINCPNGRTIIYTGSGTGAMSAVVENYVTTFDKALVVDGGSFGHRWLELCDYYNVSSVQFKVPFACDIDYKALEETIVREKVSVLLCQHHETSTGQLFDLKEISRICKTHHVSMVVDVISSFLAEEIDMDALGIDICITSTQKGLNIPPGLSIVFLSDKLKQYKFNHSGYYWDFDNNLKNLERGQTPFSPATTIFIQLHKRLKQLEKDGIFKNIEQVRNNSKIFRDAIAKYGWYPEAETPSSAITGFQINEKSENYLFKKMIDLHSTYIMPGTRPGFYRVSHMGLQSEEDLLLLAEQIYKIVNQ